RVAGPQEARQRGSSQQRASDEQRRFAVAVAVARRHGDGHDAKRGEIVGQLGDGRCGAARIGLDGTKEERRGGKARAQDVTTREPPTAARLLLALDRRALLLQYLRRDRNEIAGKP